MKTRFGCKNVVRTFVICYSYCCCLGGVNGFQIGKLLPSRAMSSSYRIKCNDDWELPQPSQMHVQKRRQRLASSLSSSLHYRDETSTTNAYSNYNSDSNDNTNNQIVTMMDTENIKNNDIPILFQADQANDDNNNNEKDDMNNNDGLSVTARIRSIFNQLSLPRKLPPIQIEDTNLLFYDLFLIINLAVSISYWVIHRMDIGYIGAAFNEGCLMSIAWIVGGIPTGAFSYYGTGTPKGAGIVAAITYVNAINIRLLVSLLIAVNEHRPVGTVIGEQIMTLEIGFGLLLMVLWRILYSSIISRI